VVRCGAMGVMVRGDAGVLCCVMVRVRVRVRVWFDMVWHVCRVVSGWAAGVKWYDACCALYTLWAMWGRCERL